MKRKTRAVTSREYKVILRASLFEGDKQAVAEAAEDFRDALASAIRNVVKRSAAKSIVAKKFELANNKKQASVRFYDTADLRLRASDYVFRQRRPLAGGKSELTLKHRHPDRFLASGSKTGGKTKFEEDIKTTERRKFLALYSLSGKVKKVDRDTQFETLADIRRFFKPLRKQIGKAYEGRARLHAVGGFSANQTVLEGPTFRIGRKLDAECALIVWHRRDGNPQQPVVVEFSFRYQDEDIGADREPFTSGIARCGFEVLQAFRDESSSLGKWVDLAGPTKTAYVYSLED